MKNDVIYSVVYGGCRYVRNSLSQATVLARRASFNYKSVKVYSHDLTNPKNLPIKVYQDGTLIISHKPF